MSFSMKDKVVIITGGSKGIGLGIVTVFAKEQAKVVFTGRNEETGKQTQQQLKEQGLDTLFLASDVSDESSMRNLMKQVYDTYGRIDILLHNAGIYPEVKLVDMTLEDWDKVHNINLRGTFIAIKEVIPYMKQQNKGKIVITSSITGPKTGNPGLAHYAASKAGVNGLIRTACLELAPWNINVNGDTGNDGCAWRRIYQSTGSIHSIREIGSTGRYCLCSNVFGIRGSELYYRTDYCCGWWTNFTGIEVGN